MDCEKVQAHQESNRKTRAFYWSIGILVGLFLYGDLKKADTKDIIYQVGSLAMIYIGGVAMTDSVRYYKYGSKVGVGNPEKTAELQERYKDR